MLTTAGLQVPVMPLVEVAGKTGGVAALQIDIAVLILNKGVMMGLTVSV